MLVDAHVHLREHEAPGRSRVGAADLLREMDASHVDAAVVLPCPGLASNEHVQRECRAHGDRLFSLYLPEFARPSETLPAMERFFEGHPARGLKIHPRFQGVAPADTIVREACAWAEARGLPVLFDAFLHGPSLADPGLAPAAYDALARLLPGCTFILAHSGGCRALDAFMVAKANPNILLDSSLSLSYFAGASVAEDIAFAIKHLWPGRTLYGSDFPEVGLGAYLQHTQDALRGISDDRRRAFYGETAAAVYKIPA
jgi:predicted TIM-barrel fold metal-dependent hydrolase